MSFVKYEKFTCGILFREHVFGVVGIYQCTIIYYATIDPCVHMQSCILIYMIYECMHA